MGALDLLTHPENYEQFGTLTPDEMAEIMRGVLDSYTTTLGGCMTYPIGAIQYFCAPPVDEIAAGLWLPADNTWYSKAAYPEFWAWAVASGKSARFDRGGDAWATPDLISKFIKAEGAGSLGDGGGQDSVTLTVANLPPHDHTVNIPGVVNVQAGVGATPNTLPGLTGTTGSTGSATPFDNRPFFSNELVYIRVR